LLEDKEEDMKTLSAKVLNKPNQPERLKNRISGRLRENTLSRDSEFEQLKKIDSKIEFSKK